VEDRLTTPKGGEPHSSRPIVKRSSPRDKRQGEAIAHSVEAGRVAGAPSSQMSATRRFAEADRQEM
jgi:hypothetical protein